MFKARARQRLVEEGREMLEIYNSFRPDTSTFITVDQLEQVTWCWLAPSLVSFLSWPEPSPSS